MVGASQLALMRPAESPEYASDADLLAACRRQELGAFEQLYRTHGARLKSVAYHMVGNRQDAEDAVQETFVKVYRAIGGFQGQSGIGTWLCRILINVCYDLTRKRRREAGPEEADLARRPAPTRELALKVALEGALGRIHPKHRMVFLLFEVEGLRHSEIAAILEIPEGTSKAWLFEAKKELKRMLTEPAPMIFQCSDLDRALQFPELLPDARAHAETCERCRAQLYLWSEISRLAPELHREWDSPSLWPRIRADLAAAAPRRRPVPAWRWVMATAAALVLAILLSQPWHHRPAASRELLTEEALHEVQQAEAAYAQSIDKLYAVAGPGLVRSPAPLAAAYREKLTVLDSAIADLKATINTNRYNAYLQTQLASLYQEKQKTLQEWLENAKHN
jgi:RNA polymerase sigma-70 factor, ECF subfamily